MKKAKLISILFLLVVVAILSACVGQNEAAPIQDPINTVQALPTHTAAFTPTPLPTKTLVPTRTPMPEVRILTEGVGMQSLGPWLIFSSDEGVFIVSQDGSEIGMVPNQGEDQIVVIYPSPSGGMVAVYSMRALYEDQKMEIRTIQENRSIYQSDLIAYQGPELIYEARSEFEPNYYDNDRRSVAGDMVWSHDGNYLALIGSINRYSSDFYIYDLQAQNLIQINDSFAQSKSFYWTPDDEYLFFSEVDRLWFAFSGSGYSGWKWYRTSPVGSNTSKVFNSFPDNGNGGEGHENFLGWVTDEQALMYSNIFWCGSYDLRLVDITNGQITPLFSDMFDNIAYDPVSQTALIYIYPNPSAFEDCIPELDSGFYWVSVPGGEVEHLPGFELADSESVRSFYWNDPLTSVIIEVGHSTKSGNTTQYLPSTWKSIGLDGKITDYIDEPFGSLNGEWIAFMQAHGDYLYVTDRNGKQRIDLEKKGKSKFPVWSLDGETLYFFHQQKDGAYSLYAAQAPDFAIVRIAADIMLNGYTKAPQWVLP